MHVLFVPYGKRDQVEMLFRDMESQKYILPLYKDGEDNEGLVCGGGIRALPLGVYDYVFPKQYLDLVVTTLRQNDSIFAGKDSGSLSTLFKKKALPLLLSRIFNFKLIPKDIDDSEKLQWHVQNIRFLVLGYREHGELTEKYGKKKGWTHEAL